ncbi:uncharacterized protein A4U43_C01F20890 [Asparagus officinalis]|uniref:Pentatricopeptide repeat-containing protein n=1 Tax=Asparagus officinalis TaxID=4686 RepID=A0A5P1FVE3_ASPOF|nr:uncharacterized protein A4U43_C01F20890 [Asparagus officinalis]
MRTTGIIGDKITIVILVLACAHLGALELGKWMHLYIQREDIEVDTVLGIALIDMYAKHGCVETSIEVFKEMPCKDVVSWTALIGGLAASGLGGRALRKGHFYFDSMSKVYNIETTTEHYGWIADLFGEIHEFVDGDSPDKRMVNVFVMIEDMISRLNDRVYDSKKSKALFNMDDEEVEDGLHC